MTSRLVVVIVAMILGAPAGSASAQPVNPDEHARLLAAAHEAGKAAEAAKTREALHACGMAYLAAYNGDPTWANGDELLWHAGSCFSDALSVGPATLMYQMLHKYYPRSAFSRMAVGRLGRVYAKVALFGRAAEELEKYARLYAGEKDAPDALRDAIRYRAGLGERDKWIELTSYYVRTFGAQKTRDAAELVYALTDAYADEVELQLAYLKDYLRRFQLNTAERIIALTRLGDLRWTRACRVPSRDGLCVAERQPRAVGRCGSAIPDIEYEVVKRGGFDRKPALAYYQEAIALQRREGGALGIEAEQALARAQLALADDALEHALPVSVPKGLEITSKNLGIRLRQRDAVARWLANQQRAVDKALAAYRDSATTHADAAATHAALYRTARATELLWHAVATVRLTQDAESACPILVDLVQPLRKQTLDAYGACAAKATEVGGHVPEVLLCLRAREAWNPLDYPPQRERVAEPTWGGGVIVVEPPLTHTPW